MRKLNFKGLPEILLQCYSYLHKIKLGKAPSAQLLGTEKRLTVMSMGQTSLQMLFNGLITFEVST